MALSLIVGTPSGLIFPFAFGMLTLFRGRALYPLCFKERIAPNFLASVFHKTRSTPTVRFPLLEVTFLTARALALKEVTKRCCRAFTLPYLFSL